MKKRKNILIIVFLFLLFLLPTVSGSICNETHEMVGNSSKGIYNWTVTRTCPSYAAGNETSIGIIIFLLSIVFTLFFIPFKINFSQSEILNDMAKRLCWLMALVLLALTTTLVSSFSATANLGVTQQLFRILWIVEWGSYLFAVWIVLTFQLRILKYWREAWKKGRMGEE